jgi:hypothetical protein
LAVTGIVLAFLGLMAGILIFVYLPQYDAPSSYRMAFRLNIVIQNPETGNLSQYSLPSGIGVSASLWNNHTLDQYGLNNHAPVYTTDNSGIVLVDSSIARGYSLGDFFSIWGKTFNSTCIQLDRFYCNDPGSGTFLSVVVNGHANSAYAGYVLVDGDAVRISYQSQVA